MLDANNKRNDAKSKWSLSFITENIHNCEGNLTIAAHNMKMPLRKLLQYVSSNHTLRKIMDQYAEQNRILAQNKLERAVKNDETWAILHTLKQETEKFLKPDQEKGERTSQ